MADSRYLVGVDLGQSSDYTAINITEETATYHKFKSLITREYRVTYLERFRGVPYTVIVKRISQMFDNPLLKVYGSLLVDKTGVGQAVVDIMRSDGLHPIGITITAGHHVTQVPDGFNVPKRELITAHLMLMQAGQWKCSSKLDHAETLMRELENFQLKIRPSGQVAYEAWREDEHDDLVLSVALPAWYGTYTKQYQSSLGTGEPWKEDEKNNASWNPLTGDFE
jgi:hypothetical protein